MNDAFDPDDLRTHHSAWRKALAMAVDHAPDEDDRSFWEHELRVYDRTMTAVSGGPKGNRILDVEVRREPASSAEAHPDGPGGWWKEENPWADKAVFVPVEKLASALGHHEVPEHWLANSARLDAYLLPQPGGHFLAGIRYGAGAGQYLSPNTHGKPVQDALKEIALEHSPAEAPRP